MTTKTLQFVTLATLVMGVAGTTPARADNASDEAFKSVIATFVESWNKHDAKALAAQYTEDGALVDPFAAAKGRAGVEKQFANLMAGAGKASSSTVEITGWAPLKGNYAIADLLQTVTGLLTPEGKTLPPTKFSVGCLASKKGSTWLLRYCHVGMLPPPSAAHAAAP